MLPKLTSCRVLDRFRVRLTYSDGVSGDMDLVHLAGKGVFQAWEEPGFFEKAAIDIEAGTIAWPGGIELDPYVLRARLTGERLPGEKPKGTSAA